MVWKASFLAACQMLCLCATGTILKAMQDGCGGAWAGLNAIMQLYVAVKSTAVASAALPR